MSLAPVLENLTEIANTSSTNDKVSLLKVYLKDKTFLKVVKYALNGDMMYGIKVLPPFKKRKGNVWLGKDLTGLKSLFSTLKTISAKVGSTDVDKQMLIYAASIDKATLEVVRRIVKKDLKCGVSAKLVNKALPGTVNTMPYMRCSTDKKIDRIIFPAIIQEKADGMFANLMINRVGNIKFVTRNGKPVRQLAFLKNLIRTGRGIPVYKVKNKNIKTKYGILNSRFKSNFVNRVYTGELLVVKNGKVLPRQIGNGILNQCIHGTASKEDAKCVVFRCWDTLPLKAFYEGFYDTVYNSRLFDAQSFVKAVNDSEFVRMVMTKRVNSYEEAHDFYAEIRTADGEGAILSNYDGPWKDHTSPNKVKMKNVSEAELEIVGWEPGKEDTKYELCMGAIKCRSAEGSLEVSVGSGFSDEEREADWEMAEGAIVTVEYESVIQDKRDKTKYSLFLPRFKEVREDRDMPDTIQDILER